MNQIQEQRKLAAEMLYERHGKLFLGKIATAHELDIGRATLDRMRLDGQIKGSKIRGSIRFALTEIARFINN